MTTLEKIMAEIKECLWKLSEGNTYLDITREEVENAILEIIDKYAEQVKGDRMKIGDEIYVHGFVNEIRNDVVIIENEGGYFGTVPSEILDKYAEQEQTGNWILDETDNSITCDKCGCLIWANDISNGEAYYCPNCGAKMVEPQEENESR